MQPTYIPWSGYFNMINSVDVFVFLNDVDFSKRSWQQRNKILFQNREFYLTIPVKNKGQQLINEVEVDDTQSWRDKHKATLYHAYSKCPFGKEILDLIFDELEKPERLLANINIAIIEEINKKLGIDTKIILSSDIPVKGKKSEYLLNICNYLNTDTYLSARGSKNYIDEEGILPKSNIKVEYHNYHPQTYNQINNDNFIPYLSIVDVIANLGFNQTRKYII